MIFYACKQPSPEWFQLRAGKTTASRFKDACDFLAVNKANPDSRPSQKNIDYAYQVALEKISGVPNEDTFVTWEMRRGSELEPLARIAYEATTGNLAQESGIVATDDERFAYSTDGFVDDDPEGDGFIEIKCPNSPRRIFEMWQTGNLDEYIQQIQGGLWITGRKWCDFVMYAPQLESIGKHLYIKRVYRDEEFIETMEQQLWAFAQRVESHVESLNPSLKEAA